MRVVLLNLPAEPGGDGAAGLVGDREAEGVGRRLQARRGQKSQRAAQPESQTTAWGNSVVVHGVLLIRAEKRTADGDERQTLRPRIPAVCRRSSFAM